MNEQKETTALNSSVGADEGQSPKTGNHSINDLSDDCNPFDVTELSDKPGLITVSMTELFNKVYQSKPPIIDGLLYRDTYILVGSPKVGKSFLMAQLAYHISTGKSLWGFNVRKGKVLYLALEDDYPRLQKRMYRMFGVNENEKLFFSVSASQLNSGLEDQLGFFLKDHPDTDFIIIDTFHRIRDDGDEVSYKKDYEAVAQLKAIADKHNICMLIVHHTRKERAEDIFEMISGTNGLLGAADGGFVLYKDKRTSLNATLELTGRDQPDQKVFLKKNPDTLIWELDHVETELWKEPPDPFLEIIANKINAENPTWSGTPTDLCEYLSTDLKPNAITQKLNVNVNRLLNEYQIAYRHRRTHEGRKITLVYNGGVSKRDSCNGNLGTLEIPTQSTQTVTQ